MTGIRAVDLPTLRADLIDFYKRPDVADWWRRRPTEPAISLKSPAGDEVFYNPTGDERRRQEITRLEGAELFFVSAPMAQLAATAAVTLPHFNLDEQDPPSATGLLLFEQPIAKDRNFDGSEIFISGASWSLRSGRLRGALPPTLVLWFSFYVDLHATFDSDVESGAMSPQEAARQRVAQPRYAYTTDAAHILGLEIRQKDSVLNLWGRTILSAWLLMRQPLASDGVVLIDRAARKRLGRRGHEPKPIRVIELRRPKAESPGSAGPKDWHHQWIVRGHWRQQWYPSREVHRPVWIAPHVKGPEGAPLIGGEKVHVWVR